VPDRHPEIIKIDEMLATTWKKIMKRPEALRLLTKAASIDRRIYALYLVQIYNWANHVARSLGLAGSNLYIRDREFMSFAFSHGIEEAGMSLWLSMTCGQWECLWQMTCPICPRPCQGRKR